MSALAPGPVESPRGEGPQPVVELRRRAMGTKAHLRVTAGDVRCDAMSILIDMDQRLTELEGRWSRFVSTSEVSRLNAAAGQSLSVSLDTQRLVALATEAWRFSDGDFDPTVFDAIVRAGYDRSFEELAASDPSGRPATACVARPSPGCAGIAIDRRLGTVTLPTGVGFDPGGLGKGLAADLLAEHAVGRGAAGVLVNLGGDLRVAGDCGDGRRGWLLQISEPGAECSLAVSLMEGGVASTTPLRRRWSSGESSAHHLFDPMLGVSTGASAPRLVTVVAPLGWHAEMLTKVVHVRWSREGRRGELAEVLDAAGASALVIDAGGGRHLLGCMGDYLT